MLQASLLRDGRNTLSEAELLAMHEQQLLGELAPLVRQGKLTLGWFMGWIASARVENARPARARETVRALLRHPSGFRLRALEVSTGNYRPITEVIAEHPASLTTIVLDEGDEGLNHHVGDLGAVMRAQPSLRSLEVNGSDQRLGPLPPDLISLILRTRELHRADVEALASEPAPALERLELWIGEESDVELAGLTPLLSRERLPSLRHLALPYAPFSNELVELLLVSDLLPGLVTLDLSRGRMTALGCGLITENAQRMAHLSMLDLRHHELDAAIAEVVSRALPNARTRDQQHNDYRRLDLREPRW